ncbi:GNAT family N-acetyltransferase [Kineococcus sp. NPDC059986]|uniref:GNAT family N-acetyltransferase n=1 Tax=Kineococcus sp. NPDC059986 TaxID=3155538 RepID=UPI00344DF316
MASIDVRPVHGQEWEVLPWLWQCFRHDLALAVSALPYPDGRYRAQDLPPGPDEDHAAYLAWRPHPKTSEPAPVGFALVEGLTRQRRGLAALWVAPTARRGGLGQELALDVLGRHLGPWSIAFQHDNPTAGRFWRAVAEVAFGPGGWREEQRPVPHRPDVAPDHWVESL